MEDSADVELYEEIVGNPAYSSSSDTSISDPVSFQFKEPRQTECREEDFFARARSRPDPRIISHALAGKNSQEPRSCDTFVECGSSITDFYDNSTLLAPTSNTSIFDTFATVAPDVEPTLRLPYATLLRYWRPTWGQRQTFPYSTSVRHGHTIKVWWWKNFTFTRHTFLLVTVKEWLKSVLNYRSYPKNKSGYPCFGPPCRWHMWLVHENCTTGSPPERVYRKSDGDPARHRTL